MPRISVGYREIDRTIFRPQVEACSIPPAASEPNDDRSILISPSDVSRRAERLDRPIHRRNISSSFEIGQADLPELRAPGYAATDRQGYFVQHGPEIGSTTAWSLALQDSVFQDRSHLRSEL